MPPPCARPATTLRSPSALSFCPLPVQYYQVNGAGNASWNGKYNLVGSVSSRPLYQLSANAANQLYLDKGAWRLAIRGQRVFYVAGSNADSLPPLAGWAVYPGGGAAPAPTLVAAPTYSRELELGRAATKSTTMKKLGFFDGAGTSQAADPGFLGPTSPQPRLGLCGAHS